MNPDIILLLNQFFGTLEKNIKQVLEAIRTIREQKKYTQEEIAEKLNIARVTYSKVESGQIELTYTRLVRICKILDVSLIQLIYGDDANKVGLEKYNILVNQLQKILQDAQNTE